MAKLNRVCFTCGQKHSYCPSCYEDRNLETWRIMFDTENCKKIFNIINKHFYNHITTDEAISQLEICDLSCKFNEDIQKEIDNILEQKKVEIKSINQTSYEKKKK
ncbi:MAG TPA: hypothetical protein VJ083_01550 [Sedimentibacter sp.]|nr:hypothetical protein [Sedimentibacter sp.]